MNARCLAFATLTALAPPALAQPPSPAAGEACEQAVSRTIERLRGDDAREIEFVGAKRALTQISARETGVKGEGRYRGRSGGRGFSYSCVWDPSTGETSGVVFRDGGAATAAAPAPRNARAAAAARAEPAPAIHTTEACESAVAADLKRRHPRVGRIVFGSDTRRVSPVPEGRNAIDGDGAVVRAPGMAAVPFSYRCVVEPRSAKVVSVESID